jgi:RND superfamily putative drug exporter
MWWMPSWLEKRLPHLNIEPPDEAHHAGAPIGQAQPQPASG